MTNRCPWCGTDPLYVHYHDNEWGVPLRDEERMFEFLILETFQAGLSWLTILKRRDGFREAFDQFKAEKIASYSQVDVDRLMLDERIIRNKQKILAAIKNAQLVMQMREQGGGLSKFLWGYVNNTPITNRWVSMKQVPARTALSDAISADMKKLGFSFVGSTVIYAHLQAAGLINDHLTSCHRYHEVREN